MLSGKFVDLPSLEVLKIHLAKTLSILIGVVPALSEGLDRMITGSLFQPTLL